MMAVGHIAVAEKVDHNSAEVVQIAEVGSTAAESPIGKEPMALVVLHTMTLFLVDTALGAPVLGSA
jgi:hypothetical protein